MAVNEKVVRATGWVTHGKHIFRPGEVMTGRAPEHAIQGALEQGVATDVSARAEEAAGAEKARRADVERQIGERSQKRDHQSRSQREPD